MGLRMGDRWMVVLVDLQRSDQMLVYGFQTLYWDIRIGLGFGLLRLERRRGLIDWRSDEDADW